MTLRRRVGRLEAAEAAAARRMAEAHAAELGRSVEELPPEALRLRAKLRRYFRGHYPPRVVEALATDAAADARAPWEAFGRFCREELGLPTRTVIAAWARPALANVDEFVPALDAAEPDATAVDTLADVLRCAWRRRALRDESAEIGEYTRAALDAAPSGG